MTDTSELGDKAKNLILFF